MKRKKKRIDEQKEKKPRDTAGSLKKVGESLGQVKDLIQKICDAEGIDVSMTPEEEAEYERREKLTDPHNDPIAIRASRLSKSIYKWLDSVPSLDMVKYQEAYDQVSWHWSLIGVKTAMAIHCQKETEIEEGSSRKFALDQQQKYSWMAYRSTQICKKGFELMDGYVKDSRIRPIIDESQKLMGLIDKKLLATDIIIKQ
ncbi:MAG: hypothetical protein NTY30_03970 [Candidatus Berkelbacteria bacterium]|nr:hypothetical protein [Candidatus Berkelbacteria bacterium]